MTADEKFQNLIDIIQTAKDAYNQNRPRVALTLLNSLRSQILLLTRFELSEHPLQKKFRKPDTTPAKI